VCPEEQASAAPASLRGGLTVSAGWRVIAAEPENEDVRPQ
ncbi:unnamed protein product, partial [Acidocella sp. C78]